MASFFSLLRPQLALTLALLLTLSLSGTAAAQTPSQKEPNEAEKAEQPEQIDFQKARALIQKARSGEKLTPEEQQYLDRARALRGRGGRQPGRTRPQAGGKTTWGLVPLTDLKDEYQGRSGGLYGEGRNQPPQEHAAAALAAANSIEPLDADGKPDPQGIIGMISNGMSNTTQEFGQFMAKTRGFSDLASRLKIVDGAQGGMEAKEWAVPGERTRPNATDPWKVLDERLERSGVAPEQVQVAWIKQARRNPATLGEFPKHADELAGHLQTIVLKLKERFPNLRLVYLSSRTYGGYAGGPLNPEPYAYESAFSVQSLIAKQMSGSAELNYDPQRGPVKAPVLLWGPYLWADGEKGRGTDDLIWKRDDFASDGTHPSLTGRGKVANLIMDFFQSDPTTKPWFVKNSQ